MWGYGPLIRKLGADFGFVQVVVGTSVVMYVLTLLTSGTGLQIAGRGMMSFLAPSDQALTIFGMSGAIPVFALGWWWTLLTASWLHGNLLHILFNMMWVRDLGTNMVEFFGPARTIIIYTVSGVAGFLLSSLAGTPYTVGASAAIFGLLGAIVHYGRSGAGSSFVTSIAMRYAVILFLFGFIMPGVDNYAHAGGFVGGYLMSMFLKPNRRERGDHLIGAAICVGATLIALVFNVVNSLSFIR